MPTSKKIPRRSVRGKSDRHQVTYIVESMDKKKCLFYQVAFECSMMKVSSQKWYDSRHDKRGEGVYERYKRQVPRKEKDDML